MVLEAKEVDEKHVSGSLGISGMPVVDRELHSWTHNLMDFFFRRSFVASLLLTTLPSTTSNPPLSN